MANVSDQPRALAPVGCSDWLGVFILRFQLKASHEGIGCRNDACDDPGPKYERDEKGDNPLPVSKTIVEIPTSKKIGKHPWPENKCESPTSLVQHDIVIRDGHQGDANRERNQQSLPWSHVLLLCLTLKMSHGA